MSDSPTHRSPTPRPLSQRSVVITADDLGREAGTTDEIVDLVDRGLVTATTLIPVTGHSEDAAARIGATTITPRLHLTLTSEGGEPPWRPLADGVDSLVEPDGTFSYDPLVLGARGETDQVLAELDAQLAWMRARGFAVTAADSHAGTLYGLHGRSWLEPTLRWCATNDLAFRLPRDPAPWFGGPLPQPHARAHATAVALADELGVAIPATMATNRRTAEDLGTYSALVEQTLAQLAALPEGTSELFWHPTRGDDRVRQQSPGRLWEARLLRDPVFAEALVREDITLVAGW